MHCVGFIYQIIRLDYFHKKNYKSTGHRRSQDFWLGGGAKTTNHMQWRPVADPENFGGGGFEAKTSKIRMSSPKLRLIFRPKPEIQTFFFAQNQVVSEKKKKVLTKIETDFSAGFVTFRPVGGMHPEMEPNYSK